MVTLQQIKDATGITGEYQNGTLQIWMDEVIAFLKRSGVREDDMTAGIVARGVMDLWNLGAGDGEFSDSFYKLAAQRSYTK